MNKIEKALVTGYCRIHKCISDITHNEKGDTNFISILIILGVVIILSGIFIGFKDQIVQKVTEEVGKFNLH